MTIKVRAILPTGGVASGKVCPAACATGFFKQIIQWYKKVQQ